MGADKRDFDKEAASWDENPARVKLAEDVAGAIAGQVELTPEMDALDFGCGTGLLALRLRPRVRSVACVDSSRGMLDVLEAKVARQGLSGVEAVHLEGADIGGGPYRLIVSSMTLHHIEDVPGLLGRLFVFTAPSGHLCIADLDSEGGRFHENNEGVFHFGFDRTELRLAFEAAGYADVRDVTAAEVMKPSADGELRRFTVFLIIGRRLATA